MIGTIPLLNIILSVAGRSSRHTVLSLINYDDTLLKMVNIVKNASDNQLPKLRSQGGETHCYPLI